MILERLNKLGLEIKRIPNIPLRYPTLSKGELAFFGIGLINISLFSLFSYEFLNPPFTSSPKPQVVYSPSVQIIRPNPDTLSAVRRKLQNPASDVEMLPYTFDGGYEPYFGSRYNSDIHASSGNSSFR